MSCPVHGGDNKNGCTIFADEKLCWKCWTHGCHEEYGSHLPGFVRGVLSKKTNKNTSYEDVKKFLGPDYHEICDTFSLPDPYLDYQRILKEFQKSPNRDYETKIDRNYGIRNLEIPSQYYINRGFTPDALVTFDIGDCLDKNDYMYNKATVPIYDENYNFIGRAGRSLDDSKPKWKYDTIVEKSQHLYGLYLAKEHILKKSSVILVEGQANIWRLYEAEFYNCVSLMGAALTDCQLVLLEKSGCTNVIIMTDMDNAGRDAVRQIKKICGRRFNYFVPQMIHNDPAEHSKEELQEILKGYK